jgi:hypothetical protein
MITVLIIAGFLGMLAPFFGFVALFVGGMFLASTAAGVTSLILVVLLIYAVAVMFKP